jgi:hypothetical protein
VKLCNRRSRSWFRFRSATAARVTLTASAGLIVLGEPSCLKAWFPTFDELNKLTIALRLKKLGVPILVVAAFCGAAIALARYARPKTRFMYRTSPSRSHQESRTLIGGALVIVACLLTVSFERGHSLASAAADGDRLRQRGSFLDVSAEPVCLLGKELPFNDPGPYMLLGSSSGRMILIALPGRDSSILVGRPRTLAVDEGPLLYLRDDVFADEREYARSVCRYAHDVTSPVIPPADSG